MKLSPFEESMNQKSELHLMSFSFHSCLQTGKKEGNRDGIILSIFWWGHLRLNIIVKLHSNEGRKEGKADSNFHQKKNFILLTIFRRLIILTNHKNVPLPFVILGRKRKQNRNRCLDKCFWSISMTRDFLLPPIPWNQLGLDGPVPSEKTSFQTAFPVPSAIHRPLFYAMPP